MAHGARGGTGVRGERYLVPYRGLSAEMPESERPALMAAYQKKYGGMPTVSDVLTALPDPAGHPVFRIRAATEARD